MANSAENPKYLEYAALIQRAVAEAIENDEQVKEELMVEENFKHFLHAFSTVVPCHLFNSVSADKKNHLEFNHIANHLCFELSNIQD